MRSSRHDVPHDDPHDQGLSFDLATLQARLAPPRLERRTALRLLGGAGIGLVLAACGSGSSSGSTTTTAGGGAGSTTTTAAAGVPTAAIPEETAGPYPGDGSNGPDVLTASGIVREDIRSSFGAYGGTAAGLPLTVELTLVDASSGSPLAGAAVYLWHCDGAGGYSLYSPGVTDQNFLRGVQEADADGVLGFTTVFPGAYQGRWPHMHFEVFPSLAEATTAGSRLVTSQLALPEDVCNEVYATAGYEQSVRNMAQTPLERDMVFSDGVDQQMATMEGAVGSSLAASLTVAA